MSFVERLRFYIFTFNVKVGICRSVIAAQFETLLCSTNHASSYQSNLAFQCSLAFLYRYREVANTFIYRIW